MPPVRWTLGQFESARDSETIANRAHTMPMTPRTYVPLASEATSRRRALRPHMGHRLIRARKARTVKARTTGPARRRKKSRSVPAAVVSRVGVPRT
jgi:hypothetical protein